MTGPGYTYMHAVSRTTVDYVLLDVGAASMASSCTVHEMEDLNTTDHLPISVEFSWTLEKTNQPWDFQWEMIDWRMSKRDGALEIFQAEIQENLYLLVGNRHDSENQRSGMSHSF